MKAWIVAMLVLLLVGCGDRNPVTPTPVAPVVVDTYPAPGPVPSAAIEGSVRDIDSGASLTGVHVRIIDGPDVGLETMTDTDGFYHFERLNPGVERLEYSLPGYQTYAVSITIQPIIFIWRVFVWLIPD